MAAGMSGRAEVWVVGRTSDPVLPLSPWLLCQSYCLMLTLLVVFYLTIYSQTQAHALI